MINPRAQPKGLSLNIDICYIYRYIECSPKLIGIFLIIMKYKQILLESNIRLQILEFYGFQCIV